MISSHAAHTPTHPARWEEHDLHRRASGWGSDGNILGIDDIETQTRQTLSNVGAVRTEGGATWDDVLKCNVYLNVYLKDMQDFQKMNNIFAEVFPENPPARTTVQTPMAEETMFVEIEAVAYIGG